MASYNATFGFTDKISDTKNIAVPQLSYSSDYSIKNETASEVVLTNVTSPLDQPELIRFAENPIRDIYKNSNVDPAARSAATQGVSLLVQNIPILRVTPADSSNCCNMGYLDFPIPIHTVVQAPLSPYVSLDNIYAALLRHFASFFGEGADVTNARLGALLRGALKPASM